METTFIIIAVLLLVVIFFYAKNKHRHYMEKLERLKLGSQSFEPSYQKSSAFLQPRFYIFKKNERWGVVNSRGKIILDGYDQIRKTIQNLHAPWETPVYCYLLTKNGKDELRDLRFKLINKHDEKVYDQTVKIDIGKIFDTSQQSAYRVKKNDLYGIVNIIGKEIIPCQFNYVRFYDLGGNKIYFLASIKDSNNNALLGMYDLQGKEIIPCLYDDIKDYNSADWRDDEDVFYCIREGKIQVRSLKGKILTPFCDSIRSQEKKGFFAQIGNKYVYIRKNKILVSSDKSLRFCDFLKNKITDGDQIYDL